MMRTYIKHKHDSDRVLHYDYTLGPIREELRAGKKNEPRYRASYETYNGGFIGVMSSEKGPVFFINNKTYLFTDPSWKPLLQKHNDYNEFIIIQNDKEILKIQYTPPIIDDWDPWIDEDTEDLYYWLSTHKSNQELIREWTELPEDWLPNDDA